VGRIDLRNNPNPGNPVEPGAIGNWDEPNTEYAVVTPPWNDNTFHCVDVADPEQPMLIGWSPDELAMHAWQIHTNNGEH
jgi:hypothetical protein